MRTAQSSGARPLRRSVVLGVVVAILLLAAGAAFAATQHRTSTAEAVLVVLPRADLDEATSAAFYETMSRGQIVGTFAEVGGNASFQNQAMDSLKLTPAVRSGVSTEVSVVPDTSVILVRTTADSPAVAEQVADGAADLMTTYLSKLSDAYRTQVVHHAADSAFSSGMSPALVLLLAAVVAVALGLTVQQATYHLSVARQTTAADDARRPPSAVEPSAVEPPAAAEHPATTGSPSGQAPPAPGPDPQPPNGSAPVTPSAQRTAAGHR